MSILPCDKRQRVIDHGVEYFRCINNECEANGQRVTGEACALCPVRSQRHVPCRNLTATPAQMTQAETELMAAVSAETGETIEATPDGSAPPNYPPMSLQVWLYKEALLKWNRAGRPVRSAEEVESILTNHCSQCDWYDAEAKRCKGCGCKVTTSSVAILNKLKMKTEECPKGLW